jgi:hypothetical protein
MHTYHKSPYNILFVFTKAMERSPMAGEDGVFSSGPHWHMSASPNHLLPAKVIVTNISGNRMNRCLERNIDEYARGESIAVQESVEESNQSDFFPQPEHGSHSLLGIIIKPKGKRAMYLCG